MRIKRRERSKHGMDLPRGSFLQDDLEINRSESNVRRAVSVSRIDLVVVLARLGSRIDLPLMGLSV
jgi:hypothetical protein